MVCDSCAVGDDAAAQDHKLEDGNKSDFSGGISNLYICKGEPGKVVEVEARGRKGDQASITQVAFCCFAILAILCHSDLEIRTGTTSWYPWQTGVRKGFTSLLYDQEIDRHIGIRLPTTTRLD